jgi:hypothetical protein
MRTWTLLAGLVLALSGCASSSATRDALEQSLTAAHSAVAGSRLAVLTFQQGRTTHAATETALADMSKQIAAVPPDLEKVAVSTDDESAQRDDVVAAVGLGVAAVIRSRDDFARDRAPDVVALDRADAAINTALDRVRSSG